MSAVKKWAVDSEISRVVSVDSLNADDRKKFKDRYVCCECGEPLVPHLGLKNDWYFSHKSDTKCKGGSSETVLHRLFKEIMLESNYCVVPDGRVVVGNGFSIKVSKGFELRYTLVNMCVERNFKGFRPDVAILHEGVWYMFEGYVSHKVDAKKLKKLRDFDSPYVLIEVNLRRFAKDLDGIDLDKLKAAIVDESDCKVVISSTKGNKLLAKDKAARRKLEKGMFVCHGDIQGRALVTVKQCRKCPYYAKGGYCFGLGGYKTAKDFQSDEPIMVEPDDLPEPLCRVQYNFERHIFGRCSCGGTYEMTYGKNAPHKIVGLRSCNADDGNAHLVCKVCGRTESIRCPKCGKADMLLFRNNKNGRVFLSCSNYDVCGMSLTLWDSEPAEDNYADELLAVEGLDNFRKWAKKTQVALSNLKYGGS